MWEGEKVEENCLPWERTREEGEERTGWETTMECYDERGVCGTGREGRGGEGGAGGLDETLIKEGKRVQIRG